MQFIQSEPKPLSNGFNSFEAASRTPAVWSDKIGAATWSFKAVVILK